VAARTDLILAVGRYRPKFYALAYFVLIPLFAAAYAYFPGLSLQCAQSDACGKFQALYFSTVTITTLGYGDVTPKG
jgi:voltage-gated potassium channel Kch